MPTGFEQYLNTIAPQQTPTAAPTQTAPPAQFRLGGGDGDYSYWANGGSYQLPGNSAGQNAPKPSSIESTIQGTHDTARQITSAGTAAAGSLIQKAYRDAFAHRSNAILGQNRETAMRLGSEANASGMSSDLARRVLAQNQTSTIGALGDAAAEGESQQDLDLASLLKSSATEQAGLYIDESGQLVDYAAAKQGAKAARSGANASIFGAGLAALLS